VGFLYVRKSVLDSLHPPMIDLYSAQWTAPDQYRLRDDARRFENWENNYAARLGLGRAIDYALDIGIAEIEVEVTRLANLQRDMLAQIDGVTLQDIGRRKCGIVTWSADSVAAQTIEAGLRDAGILVSVSSPSSTLIDARRRKLPDLVRSAVHYFNTDDELETMVAAARKVIAA
jgi:selenocysteine lyase/cysteine desulfurase